MWLDTELIDLLPIRVANPLRRNGVRTLNDLFRTPAGKLYGMRGLGGIAYDAIHALLLEHSWIDARRDP